MRSIRKRFLVIFVVITFLCVVFALSGILAWYVSEDPIENQETFPLVRGPYPGEDPYPNIAEVVEVRHLPGLLDVIRVKYPQGNSRTTTYGAIVAASEGIIVGDTVKLEAVYTYNNPSSPFMFTRIAGKTSGK